jgi:hypothetical protein
MTTRQGFDLTKQALTQYWSILVVIKSTIENIGRTVRLNYFSSTFQQMNNVFLS